jgi:hypothetical protein
MKIAEAESHDWLFDLTVVAGLSGAAVFLLPCLTGWLSPLSFRLGQTLFWVHAIALGHLLPHLITGTLLGLAAGWLIRHQRLALALLPAIVLCAFYLLYLTFGPYPYSWGRSLLDLIFVGNWLALVAAAFLGARIGLRRRQRPA